MNGDRLRPFWASAWRGGVALEGVWAAESGSQLHQEMRDVVQTCFFNGGEEDKSVFVFIIESEAAATTTTTAASTTTTTTTAADKR